MYQSFKPNYVSFVMEAQADATRRCIIVIVLVQFGLEDGGVISKRGGITPPNLRTALDFLKMCVEMILSSC